MINKPPPFKGLNIKIPIIIPIKGRGFINKGSTLVPDENRRKKSFTSLGEFTSAVEPLTPKALCCSWPRAQG